MGISQFIYSWLENIVVVFVIITLFNLVMPKGNLKRLVNLVIGLLVIYVVISPFLQLSNLELQLEQEVFNHVQTYSSQLDSQFIEGQNKEIENLYKEKIADQIALTVESNSTYKVQQVEISIYDDEEKYGHLKKIDLYLEEEKDTKGGNPKGKGIKIERVRVVSIGKKEEELDQAMEIQRLKDLVAAEFGIHNDYIHIHNMN